MAPLMAVAPLLSAAMAGGGAAMSIAGGNQAAAGAKAQGLAAQQAGVYQDIVDISAGKSDFAAAQRQAIQKQKEGDMIAGRQVALAAASGGGVNTPSIKDIYGQTAGAAAYNANSAAFPGKQRQWALGQEGADALYRGNAGLTASDIQARADMLQGYGSAMGGLSKINWGSMPFG